MCVPISLSLFLSLPPSISPLLPSLSLSSCISPCFPLFRFSYPSSFPTPFPSLLLPLPSHTQILENLASKRLLIDRVKFAQMSAELTPFLRFCWEECVEFLTSNWSNATEEDIGIGSHYHMMSIYAQCMKRLVVFGIPDAHSNPEGQQYFTSVLSASSHLIDMLSQINDEHPLHETVSNILVVLAETVLEYQHEHALSFWPYLEQFLQHYLQVASSLFTDEGEPLHPRLAVWALVFVAECMVCREYDPEHAASILGREASSSDADLPYRAQEALRNVFTPDCVDSLARLVVGKYLCFRPSDMEKWQEDPEVYFHTIRNMPSMITVGNALLSKVELIDPRKASEFVLSCLADRFPQKIIPFLTNTLSTALQECPAGTLADPNDGDAFDRMLFKEAVYFAIGTTSFPLNKVLEDGGAVDFAKWYDSCLVRELSTPPGTNLILKRRTIWLVGQCTVFMSSENRASIYEAVMALLRHDDMLLKLETVQTLTEIIEDMEFSSHIPMFVTIVDDVMNLLFTLMGQCSEDDSRVHVMACIEKIVLAMEAHITPAIDTLVAAFPVLWEACEEQNVIRVTILEVLEVLVKVIGAESHNLHPFLLPVLRHSLDPTRSEGSFLCEPALRLWNYVAENASVLTTEMMELFEVVWPALSEDFQNLRTCTQILNAYVLLGSTQFMERAAGSISTSLTSLFDQVKAEGVRQICICVDTIATLYPDETPRLFPDILRFMLHHVVEPEKANPLQVDDFVFVQFATIFCRLLLQAKDVTFEFFHSVSEGNTDLVVCKLIDLILEKEDSFSIISQRKVAGLAMCRCMLTDSHEVLSRFGYVIDWCTSVLTDLRDESAEHYLPVYDNARNIPEEKRTHDTRSLLLVCNDPVTSADLREVLLNTFEQLRSHLGEDGWRELLGSVDALTLENFEHYQHNPVKQDTY